MWIHKARQIAFIANPRTGSRELGYEILKHRGFERFLGHHGVPWGGDHPRHARAGKTGEVWWWFTQPLYDWRFYAAHRNHFEVFHSIAYAALKGQIQCPTPQEFETYLWKHPALYRNQHILFPCFFEISTCRALRMAHFRADVDAMLRENDLVPLRDNEGHRAQSIHVTNAKPREEHYSEYLTTACREWIETTYAAEMDRLGYRWEEKRETT